MEKLLSIKEFCAWAHISQSLFYRLQAEKKGPSIVSIAGRRLISPESAQEWVKAQEKVA